MVHTSIISTPVKGNPRAGEIVGRSMKEVEVFDATARKPRR